MYTPYTLDTYSIFTFDHAEESEIQYYNEEHEKPDGKEYEYDDFDWDYDNQGYLNALAGNLLDMLNQNILDDVITKIEHDGKTYSPKEYNFKTDDADLQFTVNEEKLKEYITQNEEDYNKNKIGSCDGFMWFGDEDETKLNYYLKTKSLEDYPREDYWYDQYEIYPSEFITMTLIKK